jgi:hypothetical protein
MKKEVVCQYCKKLGMQQDMIRIDDKNFHQECGQLYSDRKELYHTVCRIFNLKAPGPVNMRMINNFFEQGYTYQGMTGALTYHYDILKGDKKKGQERIGIIPYVYDKAREYYAQEKEDEKRIIARVRQNIEDNDGKENVVYVKYKEKERKEIRKEISLQDLEKLLKE